MSQGATETTEIDGELLGETDYAWHLDTASRTVWLPKSECEWDPDNKSMEVPVWLAKERGLI